MDLLFEERKLWGKLRGQTVARRGLGIKAIFSGGLEQERRGLSMSAVEGRELGGKRCRFLKEERGGRTEGPREARGKGGRRRAGGRGVKGAGTPGKRPAGWGGWHTLRKFHPITSLFSVN